MKPSHLRKSLLVVAFNLSIFLSSFSQVVSDFTTNADGWTAPSAGTFSYTPTGGNPGGYVTGTDPALASVYFYFVAPAKFLGNVSSLYGRTITFDLTQGTPRAAVQQADIILSDGTTTLYYFSISPSYPSTTPAWSSYSVVVSEVSGNWKTSNSSTGAAATKYQIKCMLQNLTSFQIRGRFGSSSLSSGGLDNVVMNTLSSPTAPIISSFSPASGLPGTTVTITGSNFGSTPAQNAVYFNDTKANVVSVSPTQLTVTSPSKISYGPITIINLANGAQTSSRLNFNPLFDNNKDFGGRIIASTFAKKVDFGSTTAVSMSVGDLDGDGWTDVVTSSNNVGALNASVHRNLQQTGAVKASSFAAPLTLTIPNSPISGVVQRVGRTFIADMDGDGKQDIIVNVGYPFGGNWDNSFVIYLNQSTAGSLSFASGFIYQIATINNNNQAIAVADIDGDGRPELLGALGNSACQLGIARNLSSPGSLDFACVQNFGLGVTFGVDISVGDLTGDAKPEIILEAYLGGAINVYENTSTPGAISFNTPFLVSNVTTSNIEVADLDNDGKNELIFKEYFANQVRIKKNNYVSGLLSAASFSSDILLTSAYNTGGNVNQFTTVADANGDNKPDIIANDGSNVVVYQNIYTSGVLSASSFIGGIAFEGDSNNSNRFVFCADVDGDNKAEILTQPQINFNFRVHRNESYPAPLISSVTPSSANAGTTVSLTGNYFNTYSSSPQLRMGGVVTTGTSLTNTSVTSTLPLGISNLRAQITVNGLSGFSKPITPTFNGNQTITSTSFLAGIDLPMVNNGNFGLAVADFDNDGKPDIIADDSDVGKIFQNTLSAPGANIVASSFNLSASTLTGSRRLAAGDFDGDGKIDVVTGLNSLFQNNSTTQPSFVASVSTNLNNAVAILTDHDFNLDGKPDLATVTSSGTQLSIFENLTRVGTFTPPGGNFASFGVGSGSPSSLLISLAGNGFGISSNDFDGDGYDDIAIGLTSTTSSLTVYRNTGLNLPITSAQFTAPLNFTANSSPTQIVAADFDGDGKIDAALGYSVATLSIFKNQSTPGTISFAAKQDIAAVAGVTAMAAQDLDGDGKPEIITSNFTGGIGSFSIFKNTSAGSISFAAPVTFNLAAGRNPTNISVADFNLDAKPDLVIRGTGSTLNFLSVFQNNVPTIAITINTQPSDFIACVGQTATYTTSASGTTNITYQWQFSPNGAPLVFTDITNGGNYAGATTATLSVNTTGNFGIGRYRCKINGDFAATVYTFDEGLFVNPIPTAPTTTSASRCGNGSVTLTAAGGTNGQYKWYTVASGGTAITGQVNGSYITPALAATTTYYVSITNGSCESSRTSVTATINTTGCAPIIAADSESIPIEGVVIFDLNKLITTSGTLDPNSIKVIAPPGSGAVVTISKTGLTITVNYKGISFSGRESITIEVCNTNGVCAQQSLIIDVVGDIVVYNALSPNGANPSFVIQFIDAIPETKNNVVTIFDRWQNEVWRGQNYNNTSVVFKGVGDGGNDLPSGTYFYKIEFASGKKMKTGFISLKR